MAIARTGARNANNNGSSLTITSFVISSGSDQVLFCSGYIVGATAPTSITHNGTSMTQLYAGDDASGAKVFTYYLIAPTVGTYNIVLSRASSSWNNMNAVSYSGVDQTTPYYGNGHVGSTASTTQTVNATATSANDWFYLSSAGQRESSANTNVTSAVNGPQNDTFDTNGTVGSTSARDYKIDISSPGLNYNYLHYLFVKEAGAASTFIPKTVMID